MKYQPKKVTKFNSSNRLIFLGKHGFEFDDYGIICHMGRKDPESLMFDISSLAPDDTKKIKLKNVCGKIGTKIYTRAGWELKCRNLYNEKYKDSNDIVIPSCPDKIMQTLSKLCAKNQGRGFVFKNYDMEDHLEFLQYDKIKIVRTLGPVLKIDTNTYLAYIERKNIIFMCYSIKAGRPVSQYMNCLTKSITYFLALYGNIVESTDVKIIGLLIQENETKEKIIECAFCNLFSPTHKVFESPTSFDEWWGSIETYRNWWNLSNAKNCGKLFDDLAAQILGFLDTQKLALPGLQNSNILSTESNNLYSITLSRVENSQFRERSQADVFEQNGMSGNTHLSTLDEPRPRNSVYSILSKSCSNIAPSAGLQPLRKSSAFHSYQTLYEKNSREQKQISMTANTFGTMDEVKFREKELSKEHGHGKSQELKYENRPVSRKER